MAAPEPASAPRASAASRAAGPKQQSYAVGVPIVIHERRSRPAPMSMTLRSSRSCSPRAPWNSVNTALPSSSPLTKYSSDGPNEPPPSHTSST